MNTLEKAIEFATKAHEGQKRWNGEPYINHPRRVAERVMTNDEKIIAWLHDTLEDTKTTVDDLTEAGFSPTIILAVATLTRIKSENYFDYIERICHQGTRQTINVKMADLTDNSTDCDEGSMKDKYRFAYARLRDEVHSKFIG